ncbi:MAG: TerB family tellurite resistance protein [Gemmatimonadetes bacterium]|nr:TerB family tellurite resistance protein [Gemmatimonadota bacterium]MYH51739.1 TerB family tellurite resistance protein [Gemmatimonadota bacterium]MYK67684.1 TerB family tellurite resistance protein [Gemmatimonadota bacterium]
MIDRIKTFFFREMAPPADDAEGGPGPRELRIAACALLLEVANADDFFSRGERRHMRALVRRHFGLNSEAADELIVLAEDERRGSVDLWGFTNLIRTHYSTGQKLVLAEAMWGLVLADGELADREDYIMRKISHLIGLERGYLAEARKRLESGEGDERP